MKRAPSAGDVRVLLLQARRDGDPMAQHELSCFARHAGLREDQFSPVNVLQERIDIHRMKEHHCIMVGGSGEFSIVDNDDEAWLRRMLAFLVNAVDESVPVFASCFGIQAFAQALGGHVIHDPTNTEVGTYELELTDAGTTDPLFGTLPRRFKAQLGHKDRVDIPPDGAVVLASSERVPVQALEFPGLPAYATQFHPELSMEDNRFRFSHYKGCYTSMTPEALKAIDDSFAPSREVDRLIRLFLERFVIEPFGQAEAA